MPRQSEALPKTCGKEGVFMYPVSDAFLQAVQENTRRYYWTGKITTKKGVVHEFGPENILKGSGYISSQCCGSTEIELGTVYATEMGITLFSQIDRYTLEDAATPLFRYKEFLVGWGGSYGNEYRQHYLLMPYLASINNLGSPVVKTADKTMKITYTLTEETETGD